MFLCQRDCEKQKKWSKVILSVFDVYFFCLDFECAWIFNVVLSIASRKKQGFCDLEKGDFGETLSQKIFSLRNILFRVVWRYKEVKDQENQTNGNGKTRRKHKGGIKKREESRQKKPRLPKV